LIDTSGGRCDGSGADAAFSTKDRGSDSTLETWLRGFRYVFAGSPAIARDFGAETSGDPFLLGFIDNVQRLSGVGC
jgi:hypothetical protein